MTKTRGRTKPIRLNRFKNYVIVDENELNSLKSAAKNPNHFKDLNLYKWVACSDCDKKQWNVWQHCVYCKIPQKHFKQKTCTKCGALTWNDMCYYCKVPV
jgi:hypothetical protein